MWLLLLLLFHDRFNSPVCPSLRTYIHTNLYSARNRENESEAHLVLLFRSVRDHERRYLSEAGCSAFDEVRRLYVAKRIEMVDTSVRRRPERIVSESDLVVDARAVLIGLPSRSFYWSGSDTLEVGF